MKQKMNFGRRGLALFVSLLMCLSFLPGRASAADAYGNPTPGYYNGNYFDDISTTSIKAYVGQKVDAFNSIYDPTYGWPAVVGDYLVESELEQDGDADVTYDDYGVKTIYRNGAYIKGMALTGITADSPDTVYANILYQCGWNRSGNGYRKIGSYCSKNTIEFIEPEKFSSDRKTLDVGDSFEENLTPTLRTAMGDSISSADISNIEITGITSSNSDVARVNSQQVSGKRVEYSVEGVAEGTAVVTAEYTCEAYVGSTATGTHNYVTFTITHETAVTVEDNTSCNHTVGSDGHCTTPGCDHGDDCTCNPNHKDEDGDGICDTPNCGHCVHTHPDTEHCDHTDCDNSDCKGPDCVDENNDGHCDVCGKNICEHTNVTYTDNKDGTHTGVCDKCHETVVENEEHVDEEKNNKCDKCGADMPGQSTCVHPDRDYDHHCHDCDGCDNEHCKGTEHVDENNDGYCDICGGDMPDDPEPVKPEHPDENGDGICDDCGACLHPHDSETGECLDPDCDHTGKCCNPDQSTTPDDTFTVTFCANGGTFGASAHEVSVEVAKGSRVAAPSANPTRDGYDFTGWDKALSTDVQEDLTYYAQWTEKTETSAPSASAAHQIVNKEADRLKNGDAVLTQIIVTNDGNVPLTGMTLVETIDANLVVDGDITVMGSNNAITAALQAAMDHTTNPRLLIWRNMDDFTLQPGESFFVTFNAKLRDPENPPESVTNTLRVVFNEDKEVAEITGGVAGGSRARRAAGGYTLSLARSGDDVDDLLNDIFGGNVPDGFDQTIDLNTPGGDGGDDPTPPTPGGDGGDDPTPPTPGGDGGDDPTPPTPGGDGGDDPTPPTPGGDGGDEPTPPTPGGDDPYIPSTPSTPSVTIPDETAPTDQGTGIGDEETPLAGAIGLNSDDHFAYIVGYEDNTVRPLNEISRAEVATIFFRLMTEEYRQLNWATTNSFSDVKEGDWYNNAISTCAKAGLLAGYEDGTFRPDDPITRAEFATIAARFLEETVDGSTVGDFTDTVGHWASADIRRAVVAGWISGEGSTFRPDENIIRADVMVIVNKMLDRTPDAEHFLPDMIKWSDNPEGTWYYEAVQEATNQHNYERDEENVETWTELTEAPKWAELEKQWADNNGASAQLSWRMPDGI